MNINRRQLLQQAAGATAVISAPAIFHTANASDGFIEFIAEETKVKLYGEDAPASDLWTYGGKSPGPEIRVKRGERVKVRLINKLKEPTSIHWHGIRIANAMDGVAGLTQEAVKPGETFEYDFVVPDTGTYWYHAHNKSWNQVARGLYGALIVEDDEQVFDKEHDLTLVIDDWRLNRTGTLDVASIGSMMDWSHGGRLGNWLTVNGDGHAKTKVNAGEAYRLRLINACNARVLEIDPNRFNAKVIAYDGQSLPDPVSLKFSPLQIGHAQRVDLLVIPKFGEDFAIEEISGKQSHEIVKFEIEDTIEIFTTQITLSQNLLPEPNIEKANNFRLHMAGGAMGNLNGITYQGKKLEGDDFRKTRQVWSFNGVANLPEAPFFSIKRGQTVIIETFNDTAFAHAMHVHGHHFRVISRDGNTLDDDETWRDTFLVNPNKTARIAFVADNSGKWLYHCHMLEHVAAGMSTWFEVT
jgi:FtsP/CotA-like multicopper oxidase with cupredoxin domain